jgi:TolA-binding protein
MLERQHEEREKEMESLLGDSRDQRAKTVEAFEKLLASERAAKAEASQRAEGLSLQIQNMQGQIDNLQGQLFQVRNHEIALETRVRGFTDTPPGKSPMGPTRVKRTFQDAGVSLLVRKIISFRLSGSSNDQYVEFIVKLGPQGFL